MDAFRAIFQWLVGWTMTVIGVIAAFTWLAGAGFWFYSLFMLLVANLLGWLPYQEWLDPLGKTGITLGLSSLALILIGMVIHTILEFAEYFRD